MSTWRIIRGRHPRALYGGELVATIEATSGNAALEKYARSTGREFIRVNNDRIQLEGDEPYTIGFLNAIRSWRPDRGMPDSDSMDDRSASSPQRPTSPGEDVRPPGEEARPLQNDDALILARAASCLVEGNRDAASQALRELPLADPIERVQRRTAAAVERPPRLPRVPIPRKLAAEVFERDGWRCHYCGRRLVVAGVIELIGRLCPDEFAFPPGHHMPKGRTHPTAERVYPNVDHVEAISLGGTATELRNLVTACTPCNEEKRDRLGWERLELVRDDWDGLAGMYRPLFTLAGAALTTTHRQWMQALGV